MTPEQYVELSDRYAHVPDYLCGLEAATARALLAYHHEHRPVGDFLEACICNDFIRAVQYADSNNRYHLHDIASYLWGELPSTAWRSKERYAEWLRAGREQAAAHAELEEHHEAMRRCVSATGDAAGA